MTHSSTSIFNWVASSPAHSWCELPRVAVASAQPPPVRLHPPTSRPPPTLLVLGGCQKQSGSRSRQLPRCCGGILLRASLPFTRVHISSTVTRRSALPRRLSVCFPCPSLASMPTQQHPAQKRSNKWNHLLDVREVPGEVHRSRRRKRMEYLCDGSGNEGEGRTVAVREGRSTRKEVARKQRKPV